MAEKNGLNRLNGLSVAIVACNEAVNLGRTLRSVRWAAEIQALPAPEPTFDGYTVPRLNLIFGRWMRHGGLYPDRKLRLFRQGFARLREDTEPHATPIPTSTGPTGALRGDLLHYQYPTLPLYQEHMRRYSTASVPLMLRGGENRRNAVPLLRCVVV